MSCTTSACMTPALGAAPQSFLSALNFFATAQCLITENWPPDAKLPNFDVFDFIIVGAGSAGCVVANRLSENEDVRVLLIEAGGDPPVESIIPALDKALFSSQYDWNYTTAYDERINQGNINEQCPWPRGKMLGGSSSINAMIYMRGSDHDYLRWYNEGNKEWHPDVIKKYFDKAENFQDLRFKGTDVDKSYGHHGPLVINTFNYTDRILTDNILNAWEDIGISSVSDLNGPEVTKAGIIKATAYNGKRESTSKAYLNPIRNRPNLKVIKNTLVTKILVNASKCAYGVEVIRQKVKRRYIARREVIISAGTINTPQLLMLSGIGPKKDLEKFKIKTISDLPVGKNLQDHLIIPVTIYGKDNTTENPAATHFNAIQYLYNRTGSFAQISISDITSFYSNSQNQLYPIYQNHFVYFPKQSSKIHGQFSSYKDEILNSVLELNKDHSLYLFLFTLLHPASRGNVTLQSSNPKMHPLIYSNTFINEKDLIETAEGIKMLTEIVHSKYFKSIGSFVGRLKWTPCNSLELDSIEYWKCIAKNLVLTVFHPIGTAKMGINASNSVVDSRLRVHGVKNLRIIDASIMPNEISGNTNGPTIMIGERGSDLIKEDHNLL